MNKRILTIFLVLLISCATFISCNNDNVNQQDSTNITSENISENNYWTFDKLVEESDYCVLVSANKEEKENWNSEIIDGEYYTTLKIHKTVYIPQLSDFPDEITIIQKENAFLEETKPDKKVRFFFIFLNKSNKDDTYYITGDKSGVIEADGKILSPLNEQLKSEIDKKFSTENSQNQSKKFEHWLGTDYFSEDAITQANDITP